MGGGGYNGKDPKIVRNPQYERLIRMVGFYPGYSGELKPNLRERIKITLCTTSEERVKL